VQLVPCGLLAPVLAGLADRMPAERLLRFAYLAQAAGALAAMGRGAMFGEIALFTGSPRSADVTAATDAELYMLGEAPFVAALTSHAPARRIAQALADRRITEPGSA
jgi:CRP-like cAMP-binding protein